MGTRHNPSAPPRRFRLGGTRNVRLSADARGELQDGVLHVPAPHRGQLQVLNGPRNAVVLAGRRWGKTTLGAQRIALSYFKDQASLYFWVGLSWRSASLKRAWNVLYDLVRQAHHALGLRAQFAHLTEHELRWPDGTKIMFRTAERPEGIVGEGVTGVVVDEATLIAPVVWERYLQPALLDQGGWVLVLGVPHGRGWVTDLWAQIGGGGPGTGVAGWEGWASWLFTTYDNPHISRERIDELRHSMPESAFRQEIMAEILDDECAVFGALLDNIGAEFQPAPMPGHSYVVGVDWGRLNDATAIVIADVRDDGSISVAQAHVWRGKSFEAQYRQLLELVAQFRPYVVVAEANALGLPLCDRLEASGVPLERFTTTATTKRLLIESLELALATRKIMLPEHPELLRQLRAYRRESVRDGAARYSAPPGFHDDLVIALALAWRGASAGGRLLLWQ